MGEQIGYARVSTSGQDVALQRDALTDAGCARIFAETASGAYRDRPELARLLDYLRPGDTLTVWKLDRLGRSLPHLVEIITGLAERGIGFRSLTEGLDTDTPGGRLIFHVMAALAAFERDIIRERTLAGLAAARTQGRVGGRRPKLSAAQLATVRRMHAGDGRSVAELAELFAVSRQTVYRALAGADA